MSSIAPPKNVKPIPKKDIQKCIGPAKTKIKEYYEKAIDIAALYFTPLSLEKKKAKKKCSICDRPMLTESFWKNFSFINIGRMDETGKFYTPVCKSCAQKLFDYYMKEVDKDLTKAMEHLCCDLNIYWDLEIFKAAKDLYEKNDRMLNITAEYIGSLGRQGVEYLGKSYWDSPTVVHRNITILQGESEDFERKLIDVDDIKQDGSSGLYAPYDWDKEDVENRKKILRVYRYDPFEDESEEDRKALARDLVAMLDDAMEDDFVKSRGALEVVRGFNRLEKIGKQIALLEKQGADLAQIQKYADIKTKERNSITSFCKDNGFAASYATKKAKGAGTLSGVMNEINEKQYERGILNMYDIETSESINQAAEASIKAIFNQLNIGGNESYIIIQNQNDMIRKLEKQLKTAQEELRKANCKIVEMKLKKKQENDLDSEDGDSND